MTEESQRWPSRRFATQMMIALAASSALALAIRTALPTLPNSCMVFGERIELTRPQALQLAATLPLLWPALGLSLANFSRFRALWTLANRSALLLTLAFALSSPVTHTEDSRVAWVVAVDVSSSIADEDLVQAQGVIDRLWTAREGAPMSIVAFAQRAERLAPADDGSAPRIARFAASDSSGSNLSGAIALSTALYPEGHLRRLLLLSDGAFTDIEPLLSVERARENGIRIDHHALVHRPPLEVAVKSLEVPDSPPAGRPFTVHATLFATREARVRARLFAGESPNGLEPMRELTLEPGETPLSFRSIAHVPGPLMYRLEIESVDGDRFVENNRFAALAEVEGRPAVLVVTPDSSRLDHFARALESGELDVDVRSPSALPSDARELSRFVMVILADVSADRVGATREDALERYVRAGGALLMAGGEHAFGLGGWQGTRIERILPVRLEGERRHDQPSLALALVIDRSGSMNGAKIELARDAARATAETLSSSDSLEIIGFDAQPERIVRMQGAANRLQIARDIARLSPRGGTALRPALDLAFQDLSVTRARLRHVILLTDGQTQESGVTELASLMRAENITVSTVGVGDDVNRSLLSRVADLGGGRSYFTADPHNIPRIFLAETSTVARSDVVEDLVRVEARSSADFLRGIDLTHAPFLRGYVATKARALPAETVLVSDLGEPILSRVRTGAGWTLAWTSDLTSRWSADWLRWRSFTQLWVQLVREHAHRNDTRELPIEALPRGDVVQVTVDALDARDEFVRGLSSVAILEGPLGSGAPARREARLIETAPGLYRADIPLEGFGTFTVRAEHRRGEQLIGSSRARFSRPYPEEFSRLEPSLETLDQLSQLTGGIRMSEVDTLRSADTRTQQRPVPLWPTVLGVALALFVFDLAVRRTARA